MARIESWTFGSGGTTLARRGRTTIIVDGFTSGWDTVTSTARAGTVPTPMNTGVNPDISLTTYSGPNAGGLLNITTPNTTYTNIDFGNTRIKISAPNVCFMNCRFYYTDLPGDSNDTAAVDYRASSNTGGGYMYRCSVINVAQNIRGMTGVHGWNMRLERCLVVGFIDIIGSYVPGSPGAGSNPIGVTLLDCFLGPMAFTYDPVGGIVHQSDTKSHCDVWQLQGGSDWAAINTVFWGYYSTTVGTGTPNSGSDTGWSGVPYTQAEGEAKRYEIVMGAGTYATPGVQGYALGGSIAGIMVNTSSSKGQVINGLLAYCYGGGGAYWLNSAGVTTGDWGTIVGVRVLDDQRTDNFAIAITPGTAVNMTDTYWATDSTTWASSGVAITRRNT